MYQVIVPLDGSQNAETSLGLAEQLAGAAGGTLELVQVIPSTVGADGIPAAEVPAELKYLDHLVERLPVGTTCTTLIRQGDPAEALLDLANRSGEAIIVMSTHGRGGVGRLLFGSVADRLVHKAPVPVALVRQPVYATGVLDSLVVPLDGSALAEEALPLAISLAHRTNATLHLVRVVTPLPASVVAVSLASVDAGTTNQDAINEARAYLDGLARRERADGVRVDWEVRTGNPAAEIVRTAETVGADLVLMSTHGRGGLERMAFGSVAQAVLRQGSVPVLMVPPGAVERAHRPNTAA